MRFRTIAAVVASFAIGSSLAQTKSDLPPRVDVGGIGSDFQISGRVVDQAGEPIVGQVVNFRIVDSGRPTELKTVQDGRFAFTFDGEGPYELYVPLRDKLAFKLITVFVVIGRDLDLGDVVLQFPAQGGTKVRIAGSVQIGSSRSGGKTTAASQRLTSPTIAALYINCSESSTEWCDHSVMHVITDDGHDVVAPVQKDQVGCKSPTISDDRSEAGWLIDSDFCCTSYPISTALVVFRLGRPIRRFEGGRAIMEWHFVVRGKQVAFRTDFLHGNSAPHYELRDVETGRLVAQWDGEITSKAPRWTLP